MKKVEIISGTYGYRPKDAKFITPISPGMPSIEVSDKEADRLVSIHVAAYTQQVETIQTDDEVPPDLGVENPIA